MTKPHLTQVISEKIRLVRNEYHITQDVFSKMIGITKKTLVQIEKERTKASWSVVISVCMLFSESTTLIDALKSPPDEVIRRIVFDSVTIPKAQTMGGKMFWRTVQEFPGFKVQQNYFSNHYRLIDGYGRRWLSSFHKEKILTFITHVINQEDSDGTKSIETQL